MSVKLPEIFKKYNYVYFLGIGGIGMSSIARYLNMNGMKVFGYDKTATPLTDELINENIVINFTDTIEAIPEIIKNNLDNTLFIFTPAIPKDSIQYNYFLNLNIPLKKRSEVLGEISNDTYCIAVAGTHGKTTTSTLVAHILKENNINFSAFLGGISSNYNNNFVFHNTGINLFETKQIVVVEADEFDRSFHRLSPDAAIITAIDPDHLDIYHTEEAFREAFEIFISKIENEGQLILQNKLTCNVATHVQLQTYGIESGDIQSKNIQIKNGNFYFDWKYEDDVIEDIEMGLPGIHNIENATAALGITAGLLKLDYQKSKQAVGSFKGAKRRFEYIVKTPEHVVIDDYAHHPGELEAIIGSVKKLYPNKKITGIFQPHLFTRTRDFAEGFASSLSELDELILMEIYPARELPIPGIDSNWLLEKVSAKQKSLLDFNQILEKLSTEKPEVLLILGAGDIDRIVSPIQQIYLHGKN